MVRFALPRALLALTVGITLHAPPAIAQTTTPAYTPSTTTTVQSGCPSPIRLINGGFEDGQMAPFTEETNSNAGTVQKIVSPGYKSKYALSVEAHPGQNDSVFEYSLSSQPTSRQCYGYYYSISYAYNWAKYDGPEGYDGSNYCALSAGTGYCTSGPAAYGSRTPGWHHVQYRCREVYGCNGGGVFIFNLDCVNRNNDTVKPFTLLLDDFQIHNAPGSPTPLPTGIGCF